MYGKNLRENGFGICGLNLPLSWRRPPWLTYFILRSMYSRMILAGILTDLPLYENVRLRTLSSWHVNATMAFMLLAHTLNANASSLFSLPSLASLAYIWRYRSRS